MRIVRWRITQVALVAAVLCLVPMRAQAQLAPTDGHYGGRASDTGFAGKVNAGGGYSAAVPLELASPRGGVANPVQLVFGGHTVGAAGVGWDVPLSYIRDDSSITKRKPRLVPNAPATGRRLVTLSIAGQSTPLVPKGAAWVGQTNGEMLSAQQVGTTWVATDGAGHMYTFTEPSGHGGIGLYLLSTIDGPSGRLMKLDYDVGNVSLDGGTAVSVDLTRVSYNYNPALGCAKDVVELAYGSDAEKPLSVSVMPTVFVRMHTLTALDVRMRSSCASIQTVRHYAFEYAPDVDTTLPRLTNVTVYGREGTAEANVGLPVATYHYGSASQDGQLTYADVGAIAVTAGDSTQVTGSANVSMSLPGGGKTYATNQSLTDVTGDGRPDLVFNQGGKLWVATNKPFPGMAVPKLGTATVLGDTATVINGPVADSTLTRKRFEEHVDANKTNSWREMIDINGDGRVDIIDASVRDDVWTVYLNTPGNGSSGVAWEERVIPIKKLREKLAMYGHTFPDDHHLPLSRHYTARKYYTNDVGDFSSAEGEFSYTEWQLRDVNGDGLPDFVFNALPVTMRVGQVTPYLWVHMPMPGPGRNAIFAMFNLTALTLSGPTASPRQDVFSAASILTEDAECGLEMWEETDYATPNQGTMQSLRCTLADVTGDGIADWIDHDHARIGMGTGISSIRIALPADYVGQQWSNHALCLGQAANYPFQSMIRGGLRDVTGDGLPDLITDDKYAGQSIYPGTGFGFSATPLTGTIGHLSYQIETCDGTSSYTHGGLFDVDGDGRPDSIAAPWDGTYKVRSLTGTSGVGIPDAGQITAIDNGYGASALITYRSAKHDWTTRHDVPFPEIVVASVRTQRAGETPADKLATTYYAYGDASMVYDNVASAFVFAGYRRSVSLQAAGTNADNAIGQASITDAIALAPYAGGSADVGYARRAVAGRVGSVTTLAGSLGVDPWSLLTVNVDTDYRQTSRTTYKYASKLFPEPAGPTEVMLDCLDWPTPYNYDASLGDALLGYDVCSAHGFTYVSETLALRGEPIANQNNVWTKTRVLEVDEMGRTKKVAYDNDVFRVDDDVCVETTYAKPVGTALIYGAVSTQRLTTSCDKRPFVLRTDNYEFDNRPLGELTNGYETSHAVDYYITDQGLKTQTVRLFDASYDALGNLVHTISVRNDNVYREQTLTYDPFGLAVVSTQMGGTNVPTLTTTVAVDPFTLDPISYTDANGTRRKVTLDGFGRPAATSIAPPGSNTFGIVSQTTYTGFSPASTLRTIRTTRFADPVADPNAPSANAQSTTTVLDELGRAIRIERPLGIDYGGQVVVSGYRTFDPFGRVAFQAEPFLSTENPATAYGTSYFYNPDGRPNCFVRAQGPHAFTASSDTANEVFAKCFYHGYSNHLETVGVSDADANQAGSGQAGVLRIETVTAIGRVMSRSTTRNGTRIEYSTYQQDRFGNTLRETRYKVPWTATPSGPVTSTSRFDSAGHVLQQTDPEGQVTRTELDSWGEPTAVRWADPATNPPIDHRIVATFDAFGRMTHREERHNGVTDLETVNDFTYDAATPISPYVTPTNLLGRMASARAPSGDTFYSYDTNGTSNATVWRDDTGKLYVEKATHRIDGTLTSMDLLLPDRNYDPEHVEFAYDSATQLRDAKYSSSTQSRTLYKVSEVDPFARITKAYYGEAQFEANYLESGRRLLKNATVVSSYGSHYFEMGAYDAVGRQLVKGEEYDGQPRETLYTYDALGRLIGVNENIEGVTTSNWVYKHDALGNITDAYDSVTSFGASMTYRAIDQDQLCRVILPGMTGTACNVTHDYFGNVTSMPSRNGTRSLEYFLSGRVRRINDPNTTATFRYDAFGAVQDVQVSGNANVNRRNRRYGNLEIRTQTVGGTPVSTIVRTFPGPGVSVSLHGDTKDWVYSMSDSQGLRFTMSSDGKYLQEVSYQPYGLPSSNGLAPDDPLYNHDQWNGGDALGSLDVSQLGARIYDPLVGRFLGRDPLSIKRTAATSNPYAFAANDPINLADPSGMDWQDGCIGVECQWYQPLNPFGGFGGGGGGGHGPNNQGSGPAAPPAPKMPRMTGMTAGACQFADGSAGCNDSMWPTFRSFGTWGSIKQGLGRGARAFGRGWVRGGDWIQEQVGNAFHWVGNHQDVVAAGVTFVVVAFTAPEVIAAESLATILTGLSVYASEFGEAVPIAEDAALMAETAEAGVIVGEGIAAEEAMLANSGELYYRTMSATHFGRLVDTGKLPATRETFISPTQEFSEAYDGVLVELEMQQGTTEQLVSVGVRDSSALTAATYPNMPLVSRGWSAANAFFKAEGGQINIGLGRGTALETFNNSLKGFRVLRW